MIWEGSALPHAPIARRAGETSISPSLRTHSPRDPVVERASRKPLKGPPMYVPRTCKCTRFSVGGSFLIPAAGGEELSCQLEILQAALLRRIQCSVNSRDVGTIPRNRRSYLTVFSNIECAESLSSSLLVRARKSEYDDKSWGNSKDSWNRKRCDLQCDLDRCNGLPE